MLRLVGALGIAGTFFMVGRTAAADAALPGGLFETRAECIAYYLGTLQIGYTPPFNVFCLRLDTLGGFDDVWIGWGQGDDFDATNRAEVDAVLAGQGYAGTNATNTPYLGKRTGIEADDTFVFGTALDGYWLHDTGDFNWVYVAHTNPVAPTTTVTVTTTVAGPTTTVTTPGPTTTVTETVEGPPTQLALVQDDRDRLDLMWWGSWATAGLTLVLMIAPMFVKSFRFWSE